MDIMERTVLRDAKIRVLDVTMSMVCASLDVSRVGWGTFVNQVVCIMFIA